MKKKILLLTIITLLLIIQETKAQETTTITNIIGDSYINQQNVNTNYGTSTSLTAEENPSQAKRILINISLQDIPENIEIFDAQYCQYLFTDGNTNQSYLHIINDSWNENTVTWANQPTYNNTIVDTENTTGTGWHCWNVTDGIKEYYANNNESISFLIKTGETGTFTQDDYYSKENGNNTPILNVSHTVLTGLNLIYNLYFVLNSTNLVQGNYTTLSTGELILNATCNLTFDSDSGIAVYNATTQLYEIYVIPEEYGIFNFTMNCSALDYEIQVQNATAYAYFISGVPYNWSVYLWENRNATTPYIDEFAYIILKWLDYNCTSMTGSYYCWQVEEYADGHADFNDTLAIGNVSLNYYSGTIYQLCDYCPPVYSSFNDFLTLGIDSFYLTNETGRIDLWVNPLELNFWTGIKTWFMTTGFGLVLLAVSFVIAMVLGIMVFNFGGRNATITIITVILTFLFAMLLFEQVFRIDIGLSSIINLILP